MEAPSGGTMNKSNEPNQTEENQQGIVNSTVPSIIEAWTLDKQFSARKIQVLDTATINFHQHDPVYRQSISNTSTGQLGSGYQANDYFARTDENPFYFLKVFDAYRLTQQEVKYYNTTTPYANLYYEQGNNNSETEQYFKAFFTHNLDSITNFGFEFNALKSPGQYLSQEARHKFLNVFASRNSERLNSYLSVINSTDVISENGGIISDNLDQWVRYTIPGLVFELRDNPGNFWVQLNNPLVNTTKSLSVFTSHEYLMGEIPFLVKDTLQIDSVAVDFKPRYGIQYSAEFENYNRMLEESSADTEFFDTTYMKTSNHTDSSFMTRFSHIFQVKAFEDTTRKFTFGKRAFIENEIVSAKHPLPDGYRKYTYSNVYVGGEINRTESALGSWSASGKFALLGRNLGDALLEGDWNKRFVIGKDTTFLKGEGVYEASSANIFQEHWFSNHYKWENNFKKQYEIAVKGRFEYPRFKASAGFNYALLSNYIYNNEQALPDQYESEFSVISAWVNKDFELGRFVWSNKAIWQELSNDAVLRLPNWSLYSSFYYSHYLFKVMKIQLGVEAYYNTQFYAERYEPSTNRFYLQNDYKVGGYPLINLFANAKLKRTSAFAMLYHANSLVDFGDFFVSPNYPLGMMAFRFGFFWTFYD